MKGIMLKDFYEAFVIKKNFIQFLAIILINIAMVLIMRDNFGFAMLTMFLMPFWGNGLISITRECDTVSDFDTYQLVYPLTKKEILLSKYIIGILSQMFLCIVYFLFLLIYVYVYKAVVFSDAIKIWETGSVISFLYLSISYTLFFSLGSKKGMIVSMFLVIVGILFYTMHQLYIIDQFQSNKAFLVYINSLPIFLLSIIISILAVIASYFLSVKIYTKKHS